MMQPYPHFADEQLRPGSLRWGPCGQRQPSGRPWKEPRALSGQRAICAPAAAAPPGVADGNAVSQALPDLLDQNLHFNKIPGEAKLRAASQMASCAGSTRSLAPPLTERPLPPRQRDNQTPPRRSGGQRPCGQEACGTVCAGASAQ
uniref:Uncharacterized protein n=1 Tax=Pipistrellus kuhlii TaxID=59472 RepID=A0A7J7ZIX6_PIPKU|nr:hypothetical protein mPipKuh1_009449 [Pipistrellus kuhlii]